MYEYLAGKLIEKTPTHVVMEVGGVGYHVQTPVSTYAALPSLGETIRLLIHFVVREDAQIFYGFATEEERRLFRLLLTVSGIRPKMAATLLSGRSVLEIQQAIIHESLPVLTGIPGIGRKTAERIIVELREKIVLEERHVSAPVGGPSRIPDAIIEDSVRALVELGYRKQSARQAIDKVLENPAHANLSVSDLIRASLKYV